MTEESSISPDAPKVVRVRITIEDTSGHTHTVDESSELSRRCANRHTRETAKILAASALKLLEESGQ